MPLVTHNTYTHKVYGYAILKVNFMKRVFTFQTTN